MVVSDPLGSLAHPLSQPPSPQQPHACCGSQEQGCPSPFVFGDVRQCPVQAVSKALPSLGGVVGVEGDSRPWNSPQHPAPEPPLKVRTQQP